MCLLLIGAVGEPSPGRNSKKGTIAPLRTTRSNRTGFGQSREGGAEVEAVSPGAQNLTDDEPPEPREKVKRRGKTKDIIDDEESIFQQACQSRDLEMFYLQNC